jgi:NAD(P)H-flavin reductase
VVERLRELGATVEVRRMVREDLLAVRDTARGTKYFACASPGMLKSVVDWLGDEEVVLESFEY